MRSSGIRRFAALLSHPWSYALVALLSLSAASTALAQTGSVTGRVTKEGGQAFQGAQVLIVGMGLGTRAAENGTYTIVNVPAGTHRVRAQMIGHRPVERTVTVVAGQAATQDFTMKEDVVGLDAIVVTGTAGQAKQREVGNAVSTIDANKLATPGKNIGELLQGKAAGMTVMPSSGMAGSGSMIRLRGNVSVAMSNQPLIYVDGVRLRSDGYARNVPPNGSDLRSGNDIASPLNDVNPNDIDRIEIIKGAAAATLYGTEAAAGVIQIFTKKGQVGRPQWNFDVDQGLAHELKFGPDPSEAPPSDTIYGCVIVSPCSGTVKAYRDSFPARFKGLGQVGVSRAGGTSSYLFIDPWLRNGYTQRYAASVGGGGDALRYFVSGTMTNEDGVLPEDNEAKKVVRGNFSFTPMSSLLLAWNTSYTKDEISNTPAGNNAHGLTLNAFRRDRNYASDDRPEVVNKLLDYKLNSEIDHLITGGTATWSPLVSLTNRFTVGWDLAQIENRNLRPFGFVSAPAGILSDGRYSYQTLTFDYAASWAKELQRDLRSTWSWGGQSVTTFNRSTESQGESFPGPGNPTVSTGGVSYGYESRRRVVNAGFFGQALMDWKSRYFLTVGGRVDGNSAFGKNFGLQTYPKASFSWVASDESFWPSWSPSMKFRAAWGQSGRAPGAFDAVRTWVSASGGWGGNPVLFPSNVGNPDLGPERTTEIELGYDASFLNDRITSEFTWYHRNIDDALFNVQQIPSNGFLNSQLKNVGTMEANGMELSANVVTFKRNEWEWTVGGSLYTNQTKVIDLGGASEYQIANFGWIQKGQAIPMIKGDRCLKNPDALVTMSGTTVDAFGNVGYPVLDTVSASKAANGCRYGPNLPSRTFGMNTSLNLPYGMNVSVRGEYLAGHYMYDGAAFNAVTRSVRWPGCYHFYNLQERGQLAKATNLEAARCTVAYATTGDFFIYPADFFKIRDFTFSANVPQRALRGGVQSARFVVSGHNVWKWVNKDFPTQDPETNNNDGFNTSVRSLLEHVPPPATWTLSLRLTY